MPNLEKVNAITTMITNLMAENAIGNSAEYVISLYSLLIANCEDVGLNPMIVLHETMLNASIEGAFEFIEVPIAKLN